VSGPILIQVRQLTLIAIVVAVTEAVPIPALSSGTYLMAVIPRIIPATIVLPAVLVQAPVLPQAAVPVLAQDHPAEAALL
jgi:hypothetical protein